MKTFVLQGEATKFGVCFQQGNGILYLHSGCLTIDSDEVKLLWDHDHDNKIFPNRRLELFAGEDSLVFRMAIPDTHYKDEIDALSDVSDDDFNYFAVSIGYRDAVIETMTFDGVDVSCVKTATLKEISILTSKPPAISSTYCQIVDMKTCHSNLEDDYAAIQLTGRIINLHRKMMAFDNNGVIEHKHVVSQLDRAADKFMDSLKQLADNE